MAQDSWHSWHQHVASHTHTHTHSHTHTRQVSFHRFFFERVSLISFIGFDVQVSPVDECGQGLLLAFFFTGLLPSFYWVLPVSLAIVFYRVFLLGLTGMIASFGRFFHFFLSEFQSFLSLISTAKFYWVFT